MRRHVVRRRDSPEEATYEPNGTAVVNDALTHCAPQGVWCNRTAEVRRQSEGRGSGIEYLGDANREENRNRQGNVNRWGE